MAASPPLKIRVQDVLLALMFGALIFLAHSEWQRGFLFAIAVLQLIEGRLHALETAAGRATSVALQLLLCFLLMGLTGGVESVYYLLLLLPILSTASYLDVVGTVVSSVAAIGVYLVFLVFYFRVRRELGPEDAHVLAIQCLMLAMAAVLVNSLAQTIRTQSATYKATAEKLAEANVNLVAAEAAVRRSDRLAALGQLSAGLAHELRNPLGSIKGSADLLARSASQSSPVVKELAGIISAEVDRTNSLVTRFLDFARPLEPRRRMTDLAEIIDRAADRAKVPVRREYSHSLPRIPLDPELMEQVFLNLITNAAQASEPGAPITVATTAKNGTAEATVVDRGCGIPADKIDTIFNPFVTTKKDGVGLGLAIVSKIVDGHGGKMSVESEPGKGTTFHVFLPLQS
jgi:two-component system, NtrC family, sensor histidine kinase HydH